MAKQDGFIKFTCDRCGKESYLQINDPKTSSFVEVERVTANGVVEKPLFCSDCLTAYKEMATNQDNEYREFISEV